MDLERPHGGEPSAVSQVSLQSQGTQTGTPKCHPANRAFYARLLELRLAAEECGRLRQARSYQRVLQSLRRFPLPLQSAHDASGLEGVGKAVMGIFQEVLEAATDRVLEGPLMDEERAWRLACRRRLHRALLKSRQAHQEGAGLLPPTQPRWSKKRRSVASHQRLAPAAVAEVSSVQAAPGSPCAAHQQQIVPMSPASQQLRLAHQEPASSPPRSPVPERDTTSLVQLDQSQPASTSQRLRQPGTPAAACRLSLGASCRRAAARVSPPGVGTAAWCFLVSLGLYSSDAHDKALARVEIERCIEQQLRPQLPRCDALRNWAAVVRRLHSRGLVEEIASSGRYRLTERGNAMATELTRKLEVPLTALSPLRVGPSAPDIEEQLGSAHKASDSDDDKPLMRTAAVAASPQRKRPRLQHAEREQAPVPLADAAASSQGLPNSVPIADAAASSSSGSAAVAYAGPSLTQEFAAYSFQANRAQEPVAAAQKRRRVLQVSRSAPDLTPARAPPKRILVPTYSAPDVDRPRKIQRFDKPQLVLLLDHREVGAGREHAARGALLADLASQLGEDHVEGRSLPLGDVLWVWRFPHMALGSGAASLASLLAVEEMESSSLHEIVAGWVVERKTFHDLSASIIDGRYDEQKSRLLEAPGLDGVLYLVEGSGPLFGVSEQNSTAAAAPGRGFGQRLIGRSLPTATLSNTAAHTQFISGFHVVHSTSTSHSVALLVALHEALAGLGPPPLSKEQDDAMARVSYREFAEVTRKSCHARVFEAFGRMLRVVPQCGPEATEVLVDEFLTPHALAAALRDSSDKDLLLRLKARRGGRTAVTASALAACRELFGT